VTSREFWNCWKFLTLTDPQLIENRDCRGGGLKRGKCGNDSSTLDAVSGISKIRLSALLHVKNGVVKADVNGRTQCSKKHVTTSSTISWTGIVRLQQFLAHLLPSTDVFIFPPHLFCAPTLPWKTVTICRSNMMHKDCWMNWQTGVGNCHSLLKCVQDNSLLSPAQML